MSWRNAFIRQARSEQALRQRLEIPEVEHSHRLHYLQMVTEKLAKAYQANVNDADPPTATHLAFVRFLQSLKGRPDIQGRLGYNDVRVFRKYVNSLLETATRIERLAPSASGWSQANPEYPWLDAATGLIHAPVDFDFPMINPGDPRMIKLERLIEALLRIAD